MYAWGIKLPSAVLEAISNSREKRMTVTELREILKRNHVPDRYYDLPGMLNNDDCHGLYCENGVWTLYYLERGQRDRGKSFATEGQGCLALLKEMQERVTWPISLDAPPLSPATIAFSEYFSRNREIFTSCGWTLGSQGFNTWIGNAQSLQDGAAYLFYYLNRPLKLDFCLSFKDLGRGSDGLSAVLCNLSLEPRQRISVRELLLTRGFTADAALFDYPQEGLPCEDHLDRFAAALQRAFDGVLKPVLEGAPISSLHPPQS